MEDVGLFFFFFVLLCSVMSVCGFGIGNAGQVDELEIVLEELV